MNKQNKVGNEHFAIARAWNLPVSPKQSYAVAKFIRNKPVEKSKKLLNLVLEKKIAIPYTVYNTDVGHKKGKGIAAGRYPEKTIKHFLNLLDSAQANAEYKGLDVSKLVITE